MKRIRVMVKDGKFKVETTGYAGESCREATARLEQRIGVVVSDEPTAEMSQQEESHEEEGA